MVNHEKYIRQHFNIESYLNKFSIINFTNHQALNMLIPDDFFIYG